MMRHLIFIRGRSFSPMPAVATLPCRVTLGTATATLVTLTGSAHGLTPARLRAVLPAIRLPSLASATHAHGYTAPPAIEQPKGWLHSTPPARSTGQRSGEAGIKAGRIAPQKATARRGPGG